MKAGPRPHSTFKSVIAGLTLAFLGAPPVAAQSDVRRDDFRVVSGPSMEIFVREIRPVSQTGTTQPPLLLVHGGGPGGLASFDLPVPGYSFAQTLATADQGRRVYVMDVRGWAGSTRPASMNQPPEANPPAVPLEEAAQDIAAVVDAIRQRTRAPKVALLGWASGGHWGAYYAARNSNKVSHLVLLNTIYGVNAPWELRSSFEAKDRPGQFDRNAGAYRTSTAEQFLARWNTSIPAEDKGAWRDPRVAEAYARQAVASDPTAATRQPPSMRIPIAFRLEAYEASKGRKYWDAREIRVPTLVVRGGRDFWSRPADAEALDRELVNAPGKRVVTIPDATHYLFNDRPDRGRERLIREVSAFLRSGRAGSTK